MSSTKPYNTLYLGAGVQSNALFLMFMNGEFDERLAYAIFADTGEEPESVYKHLEWLRSLGGPPILTDTAGKLGDDLIHGKNSTGQRFASIPAFTSATPGVTGGMLRRQCTAEYKINVVEKIIRRQVVGLEPRQRMPKGVKIVQYFGLSYDEPHRVSKVKNRFLAHPWAEGRFPLFDLEMSRGDCVAFLKEQKIPHEVPRSACVFCPYRSNVEWRLLRDNDPAGWAIATMSWMAACWPPWACWWSEGYWKRTPRCRASWWTDSKKSNQVDPTASPRCWLLSFMGLRRLPEYTHEYADVLM